jgi:hypothetical protein
MRRFAAIARHRAEWFVMNLFEDQKMVLRDSTERFERLGIAYMLTGSMAMVNYAMMRLTADIDIVIEVASGDAEKIITGFEPDYYVPHGRVKDAILRRFMFNLLHQEKLVKIDCVVRKETEFQKTAFSNRKKIRFADFDVWIIGKEDLILSKLNWAKDTRSEMQIRDAANILRNGFDENYIKHWAKELGIKDLFAEALAKIKENAE